MTGENETHDQSEEDLLTKHPGQLHEDAGGEALLPSPQPEQGTATAETETQEEGGTAVTGQIAPYLGEVIATVQKQFPDFSQQEAAQTVAKTAQQFLEDHVEQPPDRKTFAEIFDSFSDGLKAKLLTLLIQHGTRGDWHSFYERHVKGKLTLSDAVEIADLLE